MLSHNQKTWQSKSDISHLNCSRCAKFVMLLIFKGYPGVRKPRRKPQDCNKITRATRLPASFETEPGGFHWLSKLEGQGIRFPVGAAGPFQRSQHVLYVTCSQSLDACWLAHDGDTQSIQWKQATFSVCPSFSFHIVLFSSHHVFYGEFMHTQT